MVYRFYFFLRSLIWMCAGLFLCIVSAVPVAADCRYDLNQDGTLDVLDIDLLISRWHTPCATCPATSRFSVIDYLQASENLGLDCRQVSNTPLAGRQLPTYPFFEYVTAFNQGETIQVALDPALYPDLIGQPADLYIVAGKTFAEWEADNTLTDATNDGFQTITLVAGTITDNIFSLSDSENLSSDAGLGLGRPYDIVVDRNRDGLLNVADFIDGLGEAGQIVPIHGAYVVKDTTLAGPLLVTETDYTAAAGTVTAGFGAENIFYPSDIASMGMLPLVVISHGNGHNFSWYDHLGVHLASYGYVVMSHANNTVPGVLTAATTTLEHTDAFLSQLDLIDGGVLSGKIDISRIVWLGHSRGGEGVVIAVDRIVDGDWVPVNYSLDNLALVSSIAPVDFQGPTQSTPHKLNFHLWVGGADADVSGCASSNGVQSFHLHDRAEGYRQSISLHGVGHGDFHNGGGSSVAAGPCLVGRDDTHAIMKGYLLPLVKHYVEGNVPARDFLWRQWERFKPIGAPSNECVVVDLMYREAAGSGTLILDDYQSQPATNLSSSGGGVAFNVTSLTEGPFDDNNGNFTADETDAMNGMTLGSTADTTRGVVFEFEADSFYELLLPPGRQDLTAYRYLQFRAAQATRHALTTAQLGDLDFTLTLRDGDGATSSMRIGAYGGGLEEPYQRSGCGAGEGWGNEFETHRLELNGFLHGGSGLDLADIAAVRFEFGPSHGASSGRIALDEVMFSNDNPVPPAGALSIRVSAIPDLIGPGQQESLDLTISGGIETLVPDTATLHYRFDGGPWSTLPLTPQGGDQFTIDLPAPACGDDFQFYFSAVGSLTGQKLLPRDAPANVFAPLVGVETPVFTENLDTDPGWTATGLWDFGQPTGQGGQTGGPDPTSGFTGANVLGYNLNGDYENNINEINLTSPAIDASTMDTVILEFQRWLGVETATFDHAYVRVSSNGIDWTTVWENSDNLYDGAWIPVRIDITALAANQPTLFLRWVMGTSDGAVTYCGWNIDDIILKTVECP